MQGTFGCMGVLLVFGWLYWWKGGGSGVILCRLGKLRFFGERVVTVEGKVRQRSERRQWQSNVSVLPAVPDGLHPAVDLGLNMFESAVIAQRGDAREGAEGLQGGLGGRTSETVVASPAVDS